MGTRVYIERLANGVQMETSVGRDFVRWAVLRNGEVIFNASLEGGRWTRRRAYQLNLSQEACAAKAAQT